MEGRGLRGGGEEGVVDMEDWMEVGMRGGV